VILKSPLGPESSGYNSTMSLTSYVPLLTQAHGFAEWTGITALARPLKLASRGSRRMKLGPQPGLHSPFPRYHPMGMPGKNHTRVRGMPVAIAIRKAGEVGKLLLQVARSWVVSMGRQGVFTRHQTSHCSLVSSSPSAGPSEKPPSAPAEEPAARTHRRKCSHLKGPGNMRNRFKRAPATILPHDLLELQNK